MRTPRSLVAAALFSSLCALGDARAQTSNVQTILAKDIHQGLSLASDFALDVRVGNTDVVQVAGSLVVRYIRGPHLWFALVHEEFGLKKGANFLNRGIEHLRYRYSFPTLLDVEAFVQHDRDEFRRMGVRFLAGAGPRLRFKDKGIAHVGLGVDYMLEYERNTESALYADSLREVIAHRLSAYGTISVRISAASRLTYTVYLQPRLDDLRDVRVLTEAELGVVVAKYVALKTGLFMFWDSQPAEGVKSLDVYLRTALQFGF